MSAVLKPVDVILSEAASQFYEDPLGYVYWAYPWLEEGSDLEHESGPDEWQIKLLTELGDWVKSGDTRPFRYAVASGHGPGKGALTAWITHWFIDTRVQPQAVLTANSKDQLMTKTWREVALWWRRSITRDLYTHTGTKHYRNGYQDSWFAAALAWSVDKPEAAAGTHAKHVLIIFDEASAIPDEIYEAFEGAMTTPGAIWLQFGNPTRNTGRFRESFHRYKHIWRHQQLDSRSCKMADKQWCQEIIDTYGADSDIARVRVLGQFPHASAVQFYSQEEIDVACERNIAPEVYAGQPKILGVDVARSGINASVIAKRQGFKVWPLLKFAGDMDGPTLALKAQEVDSEYKSDAIMVDATGVGWSVIDYLKKLGLGNKVFAIETGDRDPNRVDKKQYFNMRAQINCIMRTAVRENLDLPDDQDLKNEMAAIEYGWATLNDVIQMPRKDSANSPDCVDAIALTYARKVLSRYKGRPRKPDLSYVV